MESSSEKTSSQILVVEDEAEIRELISLLLLRQGHSVQQCASVPEALAALQKNSCDLIVLDWMLPEVSGIDMLKQLTRTSTQTGQKIPVLMVTAKAEPENIVEGLEAGADDYITKPFEPSIFTARVKALLRRGQTKVQPATTKEVVTVGALTINMATYEVNCSGENIHLTPSEFKILSTMASNQGRVLTRDQLIEVVQGEGISVTGRTVDTHVFGLRKKLGDCADWIETIRGVGYRVKQ
jgi:two-component system phosphate regulon response regulator PhoB